MTYSIEDNIWMHFFAGKESALREVLNNLTNQLSKEIKDNITVRLNILFIAFLHMLVNKKSIKYKPYYIYKV